MRNKKGISLIVLVITIIVMIILAAAVVVSLNNTGIIGKANLAVEATNKKQIEDLAALAWADAYMEGARTQEALQDAVDLALQDVDTSKYTVVVTETGVKVTDGTEVKPELNEYGFYYNQIYAWDVENETTNFDIDKMGIVFYEDGTCILYGMNGLTEGNFLSIWGTDELELNYSNEKIIAEDGAINIQVSNGGETVSGTIDDNSFEAQCIFESTSELKKDREYVGEAEVLLSDEDTEKVKVKETLKIGSDGKLINRVIITSLAGELQSDNTYTYDIEKEQKGRLFSVQIAENHTRIYSVSQDGNAAFATHVIVHLQ